MVAPLVAGAAGAVAAPELAIAGLGAGALAAFGTNVGQFTATNLGRQVDTGKSLADTSLLKAGAAAIPQAALDTISMKMAPGIGRIFETAGIKLTQETAEQIAKKGILANAGELAYKTGKTAGVEGLTESGQQVFERLQAGLNITNEEARKEYFENFIGGAVLGGAIGGAGHVYEKAFPKTGTQPTTQPNAPAAPKTYLNEEADYKHPIHNPTGMFTATELGDAAQQVNDVREAEGKPLLRSFSIEDLHDAKIGQDVIDGLLSAKTGYQGAEVLPQNVVDAAAAQNVDTSAKGFTDFLTRTTGKSNLTEMTPPELHAAVTALNGLQRTEETQQLEEGTNSHAFKRSDYDQAIQNLSGSLQTNPFMGPTSVIHEIKESLNTTDEAAERILKVALRNQELAITTTPHYDLTDAEGKVVFSTPVKAVADSAAQKHGLNVIESSSEAIHLPTTEIKTEDLEGPVADAPAEYELRAGNQLLDRFKSEDDAFTKAQEFQKVRAARKAAARDERIAALNEVDADAKKIEEMAALGKRDTPEYEQAVAKAEAKAEQSMAKAKALEFEQMQLDAPVSVLPYTAKAVFNREAQAKAIDLAKDLHPYLKRFGLENVSLRLVDSIRNGTADGEYSKSLITIAMDSDNPLGVLRHESIHALKELGAFTDAEWKVLTDRARKEWIPKYIQQTGLYDEYLNQYKSQFDSDAGFQEYIEEEAIAEAFKHFSVKQPAGLLGNIVYRLKQFFAALKAAFKKQGFNTADSIFGRIEEGKVRPTLAPGTSKGKYSIISLADVINKLRVQDENRYVKELNAGAEANEVNRQREALDKARDFIFDNEDLFKIAQSIRDADLLLFDSFAEENGVQLYGDKGLVDALKDYLEIYKDAHKVFENWYKTREGHIEQIWKGSDWTHNIFLHLKNKDAYKKVTEDYVDAAREYQKTANKKSAYVRRELAQINKILPPVTELKVKKTKAKQQEGQVLPFVRPQKFERFSLRAPQTEAFKKWFGNSKIVDSNGAPKVMYHGTARDIIAFRPKQAGAIFLTPEPEFAAKFAGMSEDYMENEFYKKLSSKEKQHLFLLVMEENKDNYIKDYGNEWYEDAIDTIKHSQALYKPSSGIRALPTSFGVGAKMFTSDLVKKIAFNLESRANIMPVYVRAENPFDYEKRSHYRILLENADIDESDLVEITHGDWETIESESIQEAIKLAGFDGFYIKENGVKNLAVYESNQIKSATGNIGTYDIENPDIRFSLRASKEFFERAEKIPESKGVEAIRENWIGGVADIGDRDAIYDLYRVEGGKAYTQRVQKFIRKELGENFKAYRLMSADEFEELKTGAMGSQFVSVTFNPKVAQGFKNLPSNTKRKDLVIAELDLTPEHVHMIGHTGEQEVVIDYGQGYDPEAIVEYKPEEQKFSLRAPKWVSSKVWDLHEKARRAEAEASGEVPLRPNSAGKVPRPQDLKREQVMTFRRLNKAVEEYLGTDNFSDVNDLMVRMNQESSRREKEEEDRREQEEDSKFSIRAPKTEAFKKWFGKSVMVNPDGSPMVMYHGTARDISTFKPKQAGAIFVTPDPAFAEHFTTMSEAYMSEEAYLNLTNQEKNNLILRAINKMTEEGKLSEESKGLEKKYFKLGQSPTNSDGINWITEKDKIIVETMGKIPPWLWDYADKQLDSYIDSKGNIMPVYVRAENPFDFENPNHVSAVAYTIEKNSNGVIYSKWDRAEIKSGNWEEIEKPRVQRAIKELGFDSFFIKEGGTKNLAVFRSNQIKSATGNIGTYDINNPDIRFSIRAQVSPAISARVDTVSPARIEKGFVERILSSVFPESAAKFRIAYINALEGIERQTKAKAEQFGNLELLADVSALAAANQSQRAAGIAAAAFQHGVPVYSRGRTTVSDLNGTTKGLLDVLQPLMALKDPEVFRYFQFYAGVKRGQRLLRSGKEKLFEQADAQKGRDLERQFPVFRQVFDDFQAYNKGQVKYMRDTGVISPAEERIWTQNWDYIPFYRQLDDEVTQGPKIFSSISGVAKPKELTGSAQYVVYDANGNEVGAYKQQAEAQQHAARVNGTVQLEGTPLTDFIETVVRNSRAAIEAGLKNEACRRAIRDSVALGTATRLPNIQAGTDVINYKENGKTVYYRVHDPLLVESLKGLNLPQVPMLGLFTGPARILREAVTKTPDFGITNLMRDSLSAWVTSGSKMTPVIDSFKQAGKILANRSPEAVELAKMGLGGYDFQGDVKASAEEFTKELRARTGNRTKAEQALLPVSKFWDMLEKGSYASDMATRVEVYKRVLADTGNEAEAWHQAIEILNFSRRGNSPVIRVLSAIVPFLNARIQGLDVLYRSGLGKAAMVNKEEMRKAFWQRSLFLLGLTGMYWALVHDDDEYKKLTNEERDNYWIVPGLTVNGRPFRFPIPFELGTVFKVFPERILEATLGSDTNEDFMKAVKRNILSNLSFNPIPVAALPIIENLTNYSVFTDRPVVGRGLEGVAPEAQYTSSTTEVAKTLGKIIGYSPIKIDHLIRGYTGNMGMYAASMLDTVLASQDDPVRATKRFEQLPVIKRFFSTDAGSIEAFYALKREVDETVRTVNNMSRTNPGELKEYLDQKHLNLYGLRSYINVMSNYMDNIRAARNAINLSKNLTADEKQVRLEKLHQAEIKVTENIRALRKRFEQPS
jgi:hypothetical protein